MLQLNNEQLQVKIHPKGAELQSVYHKEHGLEYMWSGDAAYWGKHSPVLFPIVGQLKEDTYLYKGSAYHLPRHGFARDKEFVVVEAGDSTATFLLQSDAATHLVYPFDFNFFIHYTLQGNRLRVAYEVVNTGADELFFSVGGHPAFAVPLVGGTGYEDYYLEFETAETVSRRTLQDGLIADAVPFLENEQRIPLTHELFYKDALVLEQLRSTSVALKSDVTLHGLHFCFEGFPFLGIWAAKDAPFVCIEPWCGIADTVSSNQELTMKQGIVKLDVEGTWRREWYIDCF